MAQTDNSDFLLEQQRAVERMMEMHGRAAHSPNHQMPPTPSFVRMPSSQQNQSFQNQTNHHSEDALTDTLIPTPKPRVDEVGSSNEGLKPVFSFLERLRTEKDLPLILGLLLILWSEKADRYLMMALLYIMF
ncbi:MAG: hypothetical protein E7562_01285 [Ruminococcaceae bacterium]|nr:hypothetical protein [Oscillospiraceae bacterium]